MIIYEYNGDNPELQGVIFRQMHPSERIHEGDYFCDWSAAPQKMAGDVFRKSIRPGSVLDLSDHKHYWRPLDPLIGAMMKAKGQKCEPTKDTE